MVTVSAEQTDDTDNINKITSFFILFSFARASKTKI